MFNDILSFLKLGFEMVNVEKVYVVATRAAIEIRKVDGLDFSVLIVK